MKAIKNIRLKHYDYSSNGYYFVTINTDYSNKYLTEDVKKKIAAELEDLIKKTEGLEIDFYIFMPNHVHIIFVLDSCRLKLGEIVRRFKAKSSRKAKTKLWQPNYYEHIIRNEKALEKIRGYIKNNPDKEKIDFERFYK